MAFRIVPAPVLQARRPHRLLERHWIINRRGGWKIVITGFFEPLFYLLSIRVGFGALVGEPRGGGDRVGVVDGLGVGLALGQSDGAAVLDVDGREQGEGHQEGTFVDRAETSSWRLASSCRPTSADFSGWNWVPTTLPSRAIAGRGTP